MSDANSFSRRDALKGLVLLCGGASALAPASQAQSADLTPLSPLSIDNATAKSLGYTQDAKTVDKKKYTTYAAGQMCSTCMQFQGKPGDAYGACNIFTGQGAVNANGWCQVWVKKA